LAGTVSVIQIIVKYQKMPDVSQFMQIWPNSWCYLAWAILFYNWQALMCHYLQTVIVGYLPEVSMQAVS